MSSKSNCEFRVRCMSLLSIAAGFRACKGRQRRLSHKYALSNGKLETYMHSDTITRSLYFVSGF